MRQPEGQQHLARVIHIPLLLIDLLYYASLWCRFRGGRSCDVFYHLLKIGIPLAAVCDIGQHTEARIGMDAREGHTCLDFKRAACPLYNTQLD